MQLVLDAPVAANGMLRPPGREVSRGDVAPRLEAAAVRKFGARLHAHERRRVRQAQFAGKAPLAVEPIDILDDAHGSSFDAAVALVVVDERLDARRGGEGAFHLLAQGWLIGFHREQIVGALVLDRLGDPGVGGDGVDGDERAFQGAPFGQAIEQDGNGRKLVGFSLHRLLAEHEAARRGEGGNEMQRRLAVAAIMAAARGFSVYGDEVGPIGPGLAHPGGEGGGKQRRIDAVHQQRKPAPAGSAVLVRQVAAQEGEVRLAPGRDGVVMVAVGHRRADDEQQDLAKRMGHPPRLARIVDDREVIEKRPETRLFPEHSKGEAHGGGSQINVRPHAITLLPIR